MESQFKMFFFISVVAYEMCTNNKNETLDNKRRRKNRSTCEIHFSESHCEFWLKGCVQGVSLDLVSHLKL